MLDNLKIMLAKKNPEKLVEIFTRNNPDQLYKLYSKKPELRDVIINKLFELKEFLRLVSIAQHDQERRVEILEKMLSHNCIKLQESLAILEWLNISIIHNKIIQYISYRLSKDDIIRILKDKKVKIEAKKMLQEITDIDLENASEKINQDYLKLKMIAEDNDFMDIEYDNDLIGHPEYINPDSPLLVNFYDLDYKKKQLIFKITNKFLYELKEESENKKNGFESAKKNLTEKIKYINKLYESISSPSDAVFYRIEFFSLIIMLNFFQLDKDNLQSILEKLTPVDIFYPEYFQLILQNPMQNSMALEEQNFLSKRLLRKMGYANKVHPYNDLFFLSKVYDSFNWVEEKIKRTNNHILDRTKDYFNRNFNSDKILTLNSSHFPFKSEYGFDLKEFIIDNDIINSLEQTSELIRSDIDNFIKTKNKNKILSVYKKYEKNLSSNQEILKFLFIPLLIIGGEKNHLFVADTIQNHENLDSNIRLEIFSLLMKSIIGFDLDDYDLSNSSKHNFLFFSSLEIDLEDFFQLINQIDDGSEGSHLVKTETAYYKRKIKIEICKYIRKFKLSSYKQLLLTMIDDQDHTVKISALLALYSIDKVESIPFIHSFIEAENTELKCKIASALHFFDDVIPPLNQTERVTKEDDLAYSFEVEKVLNSVDEDKILSLTEYEDLDVIKAVIDSIARFSQEKSLYFVNKIIESGYYRNFTILTKILSYLPNKEALKIIVELLKDFDSEIYHNVIRSIGFIPSLTSINYLKNIDLKNNILLEIERLRALVILGEYEYWKKLENMLNLNISYFKNLAKNVILELANNTEIDLLYDFIQEGKSFFSLIALAKISLFNIEYFEEKLDDYKNSKNYELKYYTVLTLVNYPFKLIKEELVEIYKEANDYSNGFDLAIKTLISICFAKNNQPGYLEAIEKEIIFLDENYHGQIFRAIFDLPNEKCYGLIEKISLFFNEDIIEEVLKLCLKCSKEKFAQLLLKCWSVAKDESIRRITARYFCKMDVYNVIDIIKYEIPRNSDLVQAELAYSLIRLGDNSGWDMLDKLLDDSIKQSEFSIIDVVIRIKSKRALELLKKYLASPQEKVQAKIIKAIGEMRMKESIPILKKYANESSKAVKISLAKAVGDLKFPELLPILDNLESDPDEYVRTSIEVARQKISNQSDIKTIDFKEVMLKSFEKENWKLTKHWQSKMLSQLKKKYKKSRIRDILYFKDKVIIDSLVNKPKDLDKEQVALKSDLILTLLDLKTYDIQDIEWDFVTESAKSSDAECIKAILLLSGNDKIDIHSPNWYEIFEQFDFENFKPVHKDLFIYSLSNKLSGKSLIHLARLMNYERARYYFIFLANMLSVHISRSKLEDLIETKKELETRNATSNFSATIKNSLIRITDKLIDLKQSR